MKVWASVWECVALYAVPPPFYSIANVLHSLESFSYLSKHRSIRAFSFRLYVLWSIPLSNHLGRDLMWGEHAQKHNFSSRLFSWKHICLSPTFPNSPDVFSFFPSPSPKLAASALVPRHQLKTQQGPHTQWALIGLSLSATDNISLSVENKTNCWH